MTSEEHKDGERMGRILATQENHAKRLDRLEKAALGIFVACAAFYLQSIGVIPG